MKLPEIKDIKFFLNSHKFLLATKFEKILRKLKLLNDNCINFLITFNIFTQNTRNLFYLIQKKKEL